MKPSRPPLREENLGDWFPVVSGSGRFGARKLERMIRRSLYLAISLLCTVLCTAASARTWHVYADGSGDAPFIQAAVDSAENGDIILVGPGVYPEDWIGINNKSIELRSSNGPDATFVKHIYGYGGQFRNDVVVSGFTVEGGEQLTGGVGFLFMRRLVLQDCVVRGFNRHSVVEKVEDALFFNCNFEDNFGSEADNYGGGALQIILTPHSPGVEVHGCTFRDNEFPGGLPGQGWGGGAILALGTVQGSRILIRECLFDGNVARSGGAICAVNNVRIEHNTFVNNRSQDGAVVLETTGGSWEFGAYHNLFAFNEPYGLYDALVSRCACNAFWQNASPDQDMCIGDDGMRPFQEVDPLFCDPENGNYRLQKGSPMEGPFDDENHVLCEGPIGVFGAGCNPTPVFDSSWGSIKAKYAID
jgi:predicted outer membrane repeat protein